MSRPGQNDAGSEHMCSTNVEGTVQTAPTPFNISRAKEMFSGVE